VSIVLLNLVFGIMVDHFARLREESEESMKILRFNCFICCMQRSEFASQASFENHRVEEHNIVSYLKLMNYVIMIDKFDRNGLQDYVVSQLEAEGAGVDWLPIQRSGKAMDEEMQ
jgi:hypothetical protein